MNRLFSIQGTHLLSTLATRALPLALAVALAACGGGSSSSSNSSTPTSTSAISGTAATGNPISSASMNAVVTLKDSTGKTVTTTTDASGHYSFSQSQIAGFTAPFMLEISYQIGGVNYSLHSAVSTTDVSSGNATIDITPLTDLVIANIAGDLAQNLFNNGNFASKLTPTALHNGVAALDTILQGVLTQLGLTTSLDLLHDSFNADGTGLDSLLDALKVTVDPASLSVTITNTLNGASVSGTVSSLPGSQLSASGSAPVTDEQSIVATFQLFAEVMATNPTVTSAGLTKFFDSNFMDDGDTLATFLQQIVNNPGITGGTLSFTDFVLQPVPAFVTSSGVIPSGATAYQISFTVLQNKAPTSRHQFIVYKTATGSYWIVLGDQLKARVDVNAFEGYNVNYCSGLQLNIDDRGAFKNGSTTVPISYALITGPGLPQAGALLYNTGNGQSFNLAATGASYNGTSTTEASVSCNYTNVYAMDDGTIGGITLPADYSVALHNVTNGTDTTLATYTRRVTALPLTSTQLSSSVFPTGIMSSSSLLTSAAMTTPTPVTISWTAPATPGEYASSLDIFISSASTSNNQDYNLLPSATSQIVTPPQTSSPTNDGGDVEYTDSSLRTIWASPAGGSL